LGGGEVEKEGEQRTREDGGEEEESWKDGGEHFESLG